MVTEASELDATLELVQRQYAWRGYESAGSGDGRGHLDDLTLAVQLDAVLVGTLTVRLDGQRGLQSDSAHGDEVGRLRREGRRLCEFSRLAVFPGTDSRAVLPALYTLAYACARNRDSTDVLIEVNPRHVRFYERLLGFVPLGQERTCERVAAPSRLLHLALAEAERPLRVSVDDAKRLALGGHLPSAKERGLG